MPRQSDVAIWLHAMRLVSTKNPKAWERAFNAQQEHSREQDYSRGNPVTLDLLDTAARQFMTKSRCDVCPLCTGAGGREVPVSWNMTQGEVYETRWEPCPECGEDQS